jgi:hypothetical protein
MRQTDSPNDAVQAYVEAGNIFRKCDVELSVRCYLSAIDIYNDTVYIFLRYANDKLLCLHKY